MTEVHCAETDCEYWKKQGEDGDGLCGCEKIELNADIMCNMFRAHTDLSPEYRETFWKRLRSLKDKHECKQDARGKRYEIAGLVWFTDQDDRWGTDGIWFTEQQSGLRCLGKDIREHEKLIREKIAEVSPVGSLPEANIDDF